jgi:hypothetical protein
MQRLSPASSTTSWQSPSYGIKKYINIGARAKSVGPFNPPGLDCLGKLPQATTAKKIATAFEAFGHRAVFATREHAVKLSDVPFGRPQTLSHSLAAASV